jgi:hypothetical protein
VRKGARTRLLLSAFVRTRVRSHVRTRDVMNAIAVVQCGFYFFSICSIIAVLILLLLLSLLFVVAVFAGVVVLTRR